MATPNYGYEKRQRELAKKQKKEDKLRAKASRKHEGEQDPQSDAGDGGEAPSAEAPGTQDSANS